MSARAHGLSGLAPQQLFFPFVPVEQRAQLTELYHAHFDKAHRNQVERDEKQRRKLSLKVIGGETLPFSSPQFRALLDRPIGLHVASDLDVQPALELDEGAGPRVIGQDVDEPQGWSDAAIGQLHEGLLHYSLSMLKTKGNAEEKYEILRWIWAPTVFCWVSRRHAGDKRMIPIHRRDLPFTFERCCAVVGVRPDELRTGLAYVLRKFAGSAGVPFAELGIDIDS